MKYRHQIFPPNRVPVGDFVFVWGTWIKDETNVERNK